MTSDEYALHQKEIQDIVADWRKKRVSELKTSINNLGVVDTGLLLKSLSSKSYIRYGEVEGVGFKMDRKGVLAQHGVGKHRGINSGKNKPKRWFSEVINQATISELADKLAEKTADQVLNTSRILK